MAQEGGGEVRSRRHQSRQVRASDGHSCRKGAAMRGLPFRAGQPWQRLHLWRSGERHRDRVKGLPWHGGRLSDAADIRPRSAAQGHEPRSEEHTSELQSRMGSTYAVFWLTKIQKHYPDPGLLEHDDAVNWSLSPLYMPVCVRRLYVLCFFFFA